MCGRAALTASPEELRDTFGLDEIPRLTPHYNIPPSQPVAVVRVLRGTPRRLDFLRWGLVPAWAKDKAPGNKLTLARVETIATMPAFREALRKRRCLIVVDGFYEWKRASGTPAGAGRRTRQPQGSQPFFVRRSDHAPFALAGVWEAWVSRDGEVVESCAILTQPSRPPVDVIHDRMPLVLERETWDRWLDPSITAVESIADLFQPRSPELEAFPVSTHVNDPRHDDPDCLRHEAPRQRSLF